ncbi:MAG: ABC transporter permease [Candidatus Cloacimonadaceae bacterium]|nr:ABC transporter permease [Candidatus Cloacimonadaceae bacterium]
MDFFSFLIEIILQSLRIRGNQHVNRNVILRQILFTGYEALPLIGFTALAIGGLIILQGYNLLSTFGQGIWVHNILVTVVINELSGIFTALVVIARSGTAISTELGNMVVRREIALLRSFSISPISYLVVSRIIGVVAAMVVLTIYFNIIAVLGGWLFTRLFNPINFGFFMGEFLGVLKFSNIFISLLKPFVFGLIISITACYQGLSVHHASTEVPQRTIRTVVNSIFLIVVSDIIITWLFWQFG